MKTPSKVKLYSFLIVGSLAEPFILFSLILISFIARLLYVKSNKYKNSVFIGMMHTNNMIYVAQAMRDRNYYVQVVPWLIPNHEVGVISYDVNLKQQYPLLYSNFITQYVLCFWLFIWSIFKFDLFVMPFRTRILDRTVWIKWLEIPLLHLAGKKVILNTYGGDVATPRLRRRKDLKYSLYDGYTSDPQYMAYNEKVIAKNTRFLEKQADCIISAIDHIDYLDRVDFYFHLRCIDTGNIQPCFETTNEIPVFVHAPNHRLLKGTDCIIAAINSLNKRGFFCKLEIVENTSHDQLLEIIRNADAVIDQLLLGTYARLAIESMALGKPVFCYMRDDLFKFNTIWNDCPIINVNPDTLEKTLETFLTSKKAIRANIGYKGRKYIENYHSLEYVGKRFDEIIQQVINNSSKIQL